MTSVSYSFFLLLTIGYLNKRAGELEETLQAMGEAGDRRYLEAKGATEEL